MVLPGKKWNIKAGTRSRLKRWPATLATAVIETEQLPCLTSTPCLICCSTMLSNASKSNLPLGRYGVFSAARSGTQPPLSHDTVRLRIFPRLEPIHGSKSRQSFSQWPNRPSRDKYTCNKPHLPQHLCGALLLLQPFSCRQQRTRSANIPLKAMAMPAALERSWRSGLHAAGCYWRHRNTRCSDSVLSPGNTRMKPIDDPGKQMSFTMRPNCSSKH